MKSLLLGFFAAVSIFAQAQIRISKQNLSEAESTALTSAIKSVQDSLPALMREQLSKRPVNLLIEDRTQGRKLMPPNCFGSENENSSSQKSHRYASFNQWKWEISVDRQLLLEFIRGPNQSQQYECGHQNMHKLFLATLIHELAHAYDALNIRSKDQQDFFKQCRKNELNQRQADELSPACQRSLKQSKTVSQDPQFQLLTGWREQGSLVTKLGQENSLTTDNLSLSRSPDYYEYSKPGESFAVNLEFFALDPNYGCRRPSLDQYFRKHFGLTDMTHSCQTSYDFLMFSTRWMNSDGGLSLRSLDPSRIYEIHYLFAGRGDAMMSRWGHAMFRLVLCSPKRTHVGPECLKDKAHHVVVSYRANIGEPEIDSLKGLNGGYPSQLFLLPMAEVIQEYNEQELRELSSFPLKLSKDQKEAFVLRVLEQYWEYNGSYYFLSNNCASESLKLIKSIDVGIEPSEFIFSPLGLIDTLTEFKLLNTEVLKDQEKAQAQGYFFPSYIGTLKADFAVVKKFVPSIAQSDVLEFMQESKPEERLTMYAQALQTVKTNEIRSLAIALYSLEEWNMKVQEKHVFAKLLELSRKEKGEASEKFKQLAKEFQEVSTMMIPASWVHRSATSYGLPAQQEINLSSDRVQWVKALINEQAPALLKIAQSFAAKEMKALQDSAEFKIYLTEEMRRLIR